MRIVHVFHHFAPCKGGVETVILQLSKQLQPRHSCRVVCLNKCPKGRETLGKKETIEGIEVTRIPFLNLGFYKFAPCIGKELKNTDVLHVHGVNFFSDFLAVTSFLHRKPMILSTHGGIFHTNKKSLFKKAYFFGWNRLALKAFKKIVCVSKNDFELFSKMVKKEKLALIENGIDFEKFSGKNGKRRNSFVFVGRLSRNKRIDNLIGCFAVLGKKQDFELHIVGPDFDNLVESMKKKAEEAGIGKNVFFHGEVPEKRLVELMQSAEFFVSASEYEGFGLTALEAMAAGCIPVLNNIDSFRNFVKNAENGFIAEFEKNNEAAERISGVMRLAPGRRKEIAQKAAKTAEEFSWKKKALEYEKVYLEVAK
ncbi:MAG: glycosyltransferase family 4 protein [Candidatus ainarchaeum sp.]|nr:glycosyltransferase family 4 protein [Candidatus ainarchaeum sp.]